MTFALKYLFLSYFVISGTNSNPNAADFGEHVLSDVEHLGNEITNHYEHFDPVLPEKGFNNKGEEVKREFSEHIHRQGSNMVKKMLKNYQSYQDVLISENEIQEDDYKPSLLMGHLHSAAGIGSKMSPDPHESADQRKSELPTGGAYAATTEASELLRAPDLDDNSLSPMTTPSYFEEYATTMENIAEDTAYKHAETATEQATEDSEKKEDSYEMNESYTSTLIHGFIEEDSGKEHDPRDGRIMNKDGARRRTSGSGPTRISSGSLGDSYLDSLPSFQPRPVYPPTPSYFDPAPSHTIHTHVYESDPDHLRRQEPDVHVHVHVDGQHGLLGPQDDQFTLSDGLEFSDDSTDDGESVLGWISNIFG
eukprot:TRINITY_DN3947_c0_g1_i11.p1 TRINITY_DN3947_c0_g1~~TRINITY_DN3947_c0_g1_i11.p1  ORF type:complete len:365 (+),score=41.57 TRINITY_DN3947_c0_g1_i11:45-1139(+)